MMDSFGVSLYELVVGGAEALDGLDQQNDDVGDNAERIRNEAAFANRQKSTTDSTAAGNRDANRRLHVIPVVRLRHHQPIRDHMARRIAEGKSKDEVLRCRKRYIAREVFHALQPPGDVVQHAVSRSWPRF